MQPLFSSLPSLNLDLSDLYTTFTSCAPQSLHLLSASKEISIWKLPSQISVSLSSLTFHSDLCCALKAIDDDVTAIAAQLPSGRQGAVQDQHARLALNAAGYAQRVERVRAGGMRAGIAAAEFRHIPEWRMVIAIRTERERATLDARREGQQSEVIQRALELAIYLNITIGQSIILVAVRAIQTGRFRLEEVGVIS